MMKPRVIPLLAVGLAVFYGLLSVAAVACMPLHEGAGASGHHHAKGQAHSLLCAFVCQANQTVALSSSVPAGVLMVLVAVFLFALSGPSSIDPLGVRSARAPPR
jgi:hypothetical protein